MMTTQTKDEWLQELKVGDFILHYGFNNRRQIVGRRLVAVKGITPKQIVLPGGHVYSRIDGKPRNGDSPDIYEATLQIIAEIQVEAREMEARRIQRQHELDAEAQEGEPEDC